MPARFVELAATPAWCAGAGAGARCSAARLLLGQCDAGADARSRAEAIARSQAAEPPGRVISGGRFTADALHAALAAALPAELRASLRSGFEWYGCRGAHFHTDAHYGDVLFGAWCLAGPPRSIAFSRAGLQVPAAVGDFVVFDPFEPHAVLDPGQARYARSQYEQAAPSVFAGFELMLDAAARRAFGIAPLAQPARGMPELSSRIAVNAETGALG